jgi:hypothetical protein
MSCEVSADLGVALNYGRDPRLRDTTVLRPDWLANGIYAILRANDTRYEEPLAREGIVTLESLGPNAGFAGLFRYAQAASRKRISGKTHSDFKTKSRLGRV